MLVGAGELVKEGGLSGVLVPDQGKGQLRVIGKGIAVPLAVKTSLLPQTRVLFVMALLLFLFFLFLFFFPGLRELSPGGALFGGASEGGSAGDFLDRQDPDQSGIVHAQGELIAVDADLHGIPQRRQLHDRDLGPGENAHVQKMLAEGSSAQDLADQDRLAGPDIPEHPFPAGLPAGAPDAVIIRQSSFPPCMAGLLTPGRLDTLFIKKEQGQ